MFKLVKGSKAGALDYYGGSEQGYWRGRAAEELGLTGTVEREELEAVLSAVHPQTGQFLLGKPKRERMACLDSLLAAPKSVSLRAIAVQDGAVLAAHRQAVDRAIGQLEAIAEVELYRSGKRQYRRTGNLAVACFEHWDSRIGVRETSFDPHLHTHLAIANLTKREDGRWRALRNRPYFKQQVVIGLSYQYHLAECLHEAGYRLAIKPNGTIEIEMDRAIIEQFSKRSRQIAGEKVRFQQLGLEFDYGEIQRKTRKPKQAANYALGLEGWKRQMKVLPSFLIHPPSIEQAIFLERVREIEPIEGLSSAKWQEIAYEAYGMSSTGEISLQTANFEL